MHQTIRNLNLLVNILRRQLAEKDHVISLMEDDIAHTSSLREENEELRKKNFAQWEQLRECEGNKRLLSTYESQIEAFKKTYGSQSEKDFHPITALSILYTMSPRGGLSMAEAVEKHAAGLSFESFKNLTLRDFVTLALKAGPGQKIETIKSLRLMTGLELKEAKDYVEEIQKELGLL